MQKIKIENKLICTPKTIEHLEHLRDIEEQDICIDFVNHIPHMSIIGCLIDMKMNGKKITVLYRDKMLREFLQFFDCVEVE
jgi:hypothetical protein